MYLKLYLFASSQLLCRYTIRCLSAITSYTHLLLAALLNPYIGQCVYFHLFLVLVIAHCKRWPISVQRIEKDVEPRRLGVI
jgi:hypothetical protein